MKCSAKSHHVYSAIAVALLSSRAVCAPHLEPCARLANDYEEQVERLMRDAWPEEMQVLAIMYVPLTERGVGLTRGADGFNLIRLQFDESFWYSSWRDVEPNTTGPSSSSIRAIATEVYRADGHALGAQVLDFSKTRVRVSKLSIPISDQLGTALLNTFQRNVDAAKPEEKVDVNEIVVDGYKFEILLAKRPCVQLANPPPGSEAEKIAQLVRLLDNESLSWRPWEQKTFEAKVAGVISD